MRLNEARALDVVDEAYAWDKADEVEEQHEETGLQEETDYGLFVGAEYDEYEGEGGDDDDDALAALDAALAELEDENRALAREIAAPTHDVVELEHTWDRMYQDGAAILVATDRIPLAAPPPRHFGQRPVSSDVALNHLLQMSLNRARTALEQRRSG